MSNPTNFPGDIVTNGAVTCGSINLPDNSVGNAQVNVQQPIYPKKLIAEHVITYKQSYGSAVVAQQQVIHVANGNGSILLLTAGIIVAAIGNATVTIDFYNNGTSILATTVNITNSNAPFGSMAIAISTPDVYYTQYNVFEVVVTVNAGTGTLPQGLWVQAVFQEGNI